MQPCRHPDLSGDAQQHLSKPWGTPSWKPNSQAVLSPIPHLPRGGPCIPDPSTPWGSQDAPQEASTGAEGSLGRHCDTRLLLAAAADPRLPYPNATTKTCVLPSGRVAKLPRNTRSPALQLQPA